MKKLVLMAVAVAAVSFASCGGNKSSNAEQAEEPQVEATEVPTESVEADSTAIVAEEVVAEGEDAAE